MSRKIIAVILAFVLAISLSACGISDQPEVSSAPSQTASVSETSSAQPSATPSTLVSPSTEPSDGAPQSVEEFFGGDQQAALEELTPMLSSFAAATLNFGDQPDDNYVWLVIYTMLNTYGELPQGAEAKNGVISISSQGVLEVLDSCFAQKFDEAPAIGEAYANGAVTYSEEEDRYTLMQATGENYTPYVEEAALLENGNVELVYDVRNTELESIGKVRMEIARDSESIYGYSVVQGTAV